MIVNLSNKKSQYGLTHIGCTRKTEKIWYRFSCHKIFPKYVLQIWCAHSVCFASIWGSSKYIENLRNLWWISQTRVQFHYYSYNNLVIDRIKRNQFSIYLISLIIFILIITCYHICIFQTLKMDLSTLFLHSLWLISKRFNEYHEQPILFWRLTLNICDNENLEGKTFSICWKLLFDLKGFIRTIDRRA